ncbi:MAG: BglG family transcription antiterminator [Anaerostipes sp.]|jgi:mannitol operon transcriptional antiterminator|nr:BglG family transcription antiterminator [Anaerostipes sp.]
MDSRSNKILNRIVQKGTGTIKYFADTFYLSERMVRNIIKDLNEELEEKGLPLLVVSKDGQIYFEETGELLEERIRQFIITKDFYTYRLSPTERKTIVAMILLNQDDYCTAATISENLGTSRNTILKDIDEMKKWFLENKLKLESLVQKGYLVSGKERDIRKGILKLIELNLDCYEYENSEISSAFQHLLLKQLHYERIIKRIQEIVKKAEQTYHTRFSDFSFTEAVYEILIVLERVRSNKIIAEKIGDEILNSSKYPISHFIFTEIEKQYQIVIPPIERKYFVRCLRRKSYIESSTTNIAEVVIPIMIGETIHKISRRLKISFYLDFSLYDVLVDHMKSAIFRLQNGEVLVNPFGKEIEEKYPVITKITQEALIPIEEYIGEKFGNDEISFLVMYFASIMEKNRLEDKKKKKVSVCIVGATGRGTMQLLRAGLAEFNDILEIVEIRPVHEIEHIKEEEIEMIISLVPFFSKRIPCVIIDSPILKKEDIYKIRMMAMELQETHQLIENEKIKESIAMDKANALKVRTIGEFLPVNRIILDAEAENWEDAVRISGRALYEDGITTETYIEAMVDVVRENGSYIVICPGLAIPHAEEEKGILQEGISLIRLKNPVYFENTENNPVTYVAGLSVTSAESVNFVIYNLVQLFENPKRIEKLNEIKNSQDMYEFICSLRD